MDVYRFNRTPLRMVNFYTFVLLGIVASLGINSKLRAWISNVVVDSVSWLLNVRYPESNTLPPDDNAYTEVPAFCKPNTFRQWRTSYTDVRVSLAKRARRRWKVPRGRKK